MRILKKLSKWLDGSPRMIMIVYYDLTTNQIKCVDWGSVKIKRLCGELTPELWEELNNYCYKESNNHKLNHYWHVPTRIYIWSGIETKHLAYGEPIDNYLKDFSLLKTGQWFSFESGIRYGEKFKWKKICPTC